MDEERYLGKHTEQREENSKEYNKEENKGDFKRNIRGKKKTEREKLNGRAERTIRNSFVKKNISRDHNTTKKKNREGNDRKRINDAE